MDDAKCLKDVIHNYVGKYVKIGGKCGFFFCGNIPKNYEEMFEDIKLIQSEQLFKTKARIEEDINDFERQWDQRRKKREQNPTFFDQKEIDLFEANKLHARELLEERLKRAEDALTNIPSILSYQISDTYKSTIDSATIILLDCGLKGSMSNRAEMIKKPAYAKLAKKYDV